MKRLAIVFALLLASPIYAETATAPSADVLQKQIAALQQEVTSLRAENLAMKRIISGDKALSASYVQSPKVKADITDFKNQILKNLTVDAAWKLLQDYGAAGPDAPTLDSSARGDSHYSLYCNSLWNNCVWRVGVSEGKIISFSMDRVSSRAITH